MIERSSDDRPLGERVPRPLPQAGDSNLQLWLAEMQAAADDLDDAVDDARISSQLPNASGRALDELGKDFGPLGKRRGRDDEEYRSFLSGLVAAFDGRGTRSGIRVAVGAGIATDPDNISVIEDTTNLEYSVEIENEAWPSHRSSTVRELAELADPSVVNLTPPIRYSVGTVDLTLSTVATLVEEIATESESAELSLSIGSLGFRTLSKEGLSASELGPLSSGEWDISAGDSGTIDTGTAVIRLAPDATQNDSGTVSTTAALNQSPGASSSETINIGLSASGLAPLSTGSRWDIS